MKEQFIPYELALELKNLGFDEPCLSTYHTKTKEIIKIFGEFKKQPEKEIYWILAPLWQQAFDWFRKNKLIDSNIERKDYIGDNFDYYFYTICGSEKNSNILVDNDDLGKTKQIYEEARQACLEKLIEIIKGNE